jgi:hypothetical protein
MLLSNISLKPSGSKSKQGKKRTEAGGKLSSLASICKLNGIKSQNTILIIKNHTHDALCFNHGVESWHEN